MEVEISMKLVVDGGTPVEFHYTLEDGSDAEFRDLVQDARKKLCHKLKYQIEELVK